MVKQDQKYIVKYVVSGNVQKVGYRQWIKNQALLEGLDGYAKNLNDGNVEVTVGGKDINIVEKFKEKCLKGSPNSLVKGISSTHWRGSLKKGFEIKKSEDSDMNINTMGFQEVLDREQSSKIVGYMRSRNKPGHMAKLLAIMGKYKGIELIYINPENVTMENDIIYGKILKNEKWINVKAYLPKFIDINPNYFNKTQYKPLITYLRKNTTLSSDKRMPLPKNELQKYFSEDPDVSKYLIPTKKVDTLNDVITYLNLYSRIVLKPVFSNRGRNVYVLQYDKNSATHYTLGLNKEEKVLTHKELEYFFDTNIKNKGFITQKYISSKNSQGDPFDCRIHVEKNGKGKWSNPKNFVRIGVGQKVISNVSQGGGISEVKNFLKSTYPEKWEDIYKEIKKIAKTLPYKIEKVLGKKYMTFGFDVGIDDNGDLYIYEINDFPIVSPMKSEIAMARTGYYKYMLRLNEDSSN